LIERTLRWAAMYLRSREPSDFAGMGRHRFVADLLARAHRLLTPPGPEDEGLWPRLVALAGTIPGRWGRAPRTVGECLHEGRDCAHHLGPSSYEIRSPSRLPRRSGEDRLDLQRIDGPYLGLGAGRRDQLDWASRGGDEVMMASDGLFEQPECNSPLRQLETSRARRATGHLAAGRSLYQAVLAVLEEALRACGQRDHITVMTIGHRLQDAAGRRGEHVPV
jgi:hypothetical protein